MSPEVMSRIEALRDEAVSLLEELVRVNSVNPNYPGIDRASVIGGETRCNEILKERYEQAGLETHWAFEDPERKALVGVRKGEGGGRSLLFNGHVDTVPPAEGGDWTHGSPWEPVIRDGRLYGLGSTDMKASAVSMWLAAQALHDVHHAWLANKQGWGTTYKNLRAAARQFALPYDWQTLVDTYWVPFIQRMWDETRPRVWGPMQKVWENKDFGVPDVEEAPERQVIEVDQSSSVNGASPVEEPVKV